MSLHPPPLSMGQRACTLMRWLALKATHRMASRYHHANWLHEFNQFLDWEGQESPCETLDEFEARRQRLTDRALTFAWPPLTDPDSLAERWASPLMRNHLYAFIARRERLALSWLRLMRHLPRRGRIAEFGAGAAPLVHGVTRAWPFPRPLIDVIDLPWVLQDYCRWRFHHEPHVTVCRDLVSPYDAIVCTETLEHVWSPQATAARLMNALRVGGRLLWDYSVQTQDGPLAPRGLSARDDTIRYLQTIGPCHGPYRGGLYVTWKRSPNDT